MKIGIVGESDYAIANTEGDVWSVHGFAISTSDLSFYRILHSAFATPARYIEEIFLRLCALEEDGQRSPKLVFNPLYDSGSLGIQLVLAAIGEAIPFEGVTVLVDVDGLPAGYILPASIESDDTRFLNLLSTVDGDLDSKICRMLFQTGIRCLQVPHLSLARAQHNGFYYKENLDIYRWLAERNLAMLLSRQERALKDGFFTAVMPHHAGDVLFFSLAFNRVRSHFNRIAVNQVYVDIVKDQAPGLAVLPISTTPINRGVDLRQGKSTPDKNYFDTIKEHLLGEGFYYYCRASRDYNLAQFHLIDQYAFALGGRFFSEKDLVTCQKPRPEPFQPELPVDGSARILLHFDGGWPLKVYPKAQQDCLIDLLVAKGYAVTILDGGTYANTKCLSKVFESFAQFKELVQSHHLLVGMDSFPSHYAAHVVGLPTICLFASTRPENSNAPAAANYLYLEKGLGCRPCYGTAKCLLYWSDYCRNFSTPEKVVEEIERMLRLAQQHDGKHEAAALPSAGEQEKCLPPLNRKDAAPIERINPKFLGAQAILAALVWLLIPPLPAAFRLQREFTESLKREGLLLTYLRTLRFLRSTFRRNGS